MIRARLIGALVAVAASCAACTSGMSPHAINSPHSTTPVVLTGRETSMLRSYGTSDTTFGLGLLSSICASSAGGSGGSGPANVAISPVSVASSLGLALLGARGDTAKVMAKTMHLPAASLARLVAGLRVRSALLASLQGPGVTFAQSNHVWADRALPTRRAYLKAVRTADQAGLTRLPLMSDPGQAAKTINAAIAADTHGHITHLISPEALGGQTGWVLTNALYLDAAWAQPFSPEATRKGPFATGPGHVTASYLNGGIFRFAHHAGFTAAALPYRGHRLAMIALMPAHERAAGDGCALPSPAELRSLESRLGTTKHKTSIALPKVKLSWSGSLNQPLTSLGMGMAFGPRADFTGISGQACCIGFVQHAATLEVAEKGTIASAATATGVSATALAAGGKLRFDRPYLMVLEDTRTGEPLMLAWVANPSGS